MDRRRAIAEAVSIILHPVLLAIIGLAYLTGYFSDSSREFYQWTIVGLLLLTGAPAIYMLVLYFFGIEDDLALRDRHHRPIPLLLATVGAAIGGYIVFARGLNHNLIILSAVLVVDLLMLTGITAFWKISVHTTTLSALVVLLIIFRGVSYAPLFLLLLPVAWARYTLRRHTGTQLLGGAVIGSTLTFLVNWYAK